MRTLEPTKFVPGGPRGGEHWRLCIFYDGFLCLESISDATLNRPGVPAPWAFAGEVPRSIANYYRRHPERVLDVIDRARRALGY